MKFVKCLRAPDFEEHMRMTACESKPLRCIVFINAMANITSRGKVSFNHDLLFHYSRFISTIERIFSPAIRSIPVLGNEKNHYYVMLCYVVN